MFRKFGYKVGLVSTVCNYIDDKQIPTSHTTPDPITLNRLLGQMADEGCKYVFMEVSSHSVSQKRIGGLKFAGGIFTNLTRDHLDYHKTVDNYLKAKKTFFDNLPKSAFALTNADDKNGLVMTQNTKAKVCTYSLRNISDFKAKVLEDSFEGMLLDMDGKEICVQFIGRFNASRCTSVICFFFNKDMKNSPKMVEIKSAKIIAISERKDTYPNILAPGKLIFSKCSNK